jgi:hypothetical protein
MLQCNWALSSKLPLPWPKPNTDQKGVDIMLPLADALQQLRPWAAAPNAQLPPGVTSPAFAPPGGPPAADSRSLAASLAAGRGRRGVQLDITNLPGLEALTAKVACLSPPDFLLVSHAQAPNRSRSNLVVLWLQEGMACAAGIAACPVLEEVTTEH